MSLDESIAVPRKRSRATAEQLAVLEEMFAVNVSPSSKLRKELAAKLKMTDRSIQIWFQNRRAKVKHMQKKAQLQLHQAALKAQLHHYQQQHFYLQQKFGTSGLHYRTQSADSYHQQPRSTWPSSQQRQSVPPTLAPAPSESLPLTTASPSYPDVTMYPWLPAAGSVHMQENGSTIDPHQLSKSERQTFGVSALTVGKWHRIKMCERDLDCIYEKETDSLCWYIVDGAHQFKMEMPVADIQSFVLTVLGPQGMITLTLNQAPSFFMKHADSGWMPCSDFTEYQQASQVLQHTLRGDALTMRQDMASLLSTNPDAKAWAHLVEPNLTPTTEIPLASLDQSFELMKDDEYEHFHCMMASQPSTLSSSSSTSSSSLSTSPPLLPVNAITLLEKDLAPDSTLPNEFLVDTTFLDPSMWSMLS